MPRKGKIQPVPTKLPVDTTQLLASAVSRLQRTLYGISAAKHKELLQKQLTAALDDDSPNQVAAWLALQGWSKIDAVCAKTVFDAVIQAAYSNQQVDNTPQGRNLIDDNQLSEGIAGLLTHHEEGEAEAPTVRLPDSTRPVLDMPVDSDDGAGPLAKRSTRADSNTG